ncbi:MAG: stage III sporulation protein AD [Oscillospiraceae bacterium]|jgi:stage III sporulation protein AD|nr:stage III sporulation protein AD [Oscillospiraceae bacterium]
MNEVIKICAVALVTALVVLLLRQYKPEFAPIAAMAGVAAIALLLLRTLPSILGLADSFLAFGGMDAGWLKLLLKALGIAVLIQTAADLCRDNQNAALAGAVELAGKVMILLLAVPLLRAAAEIAVGLINK